MSCFDCSGFFDEFDDFKRFSIFFNYFRRMPVVQVNLTSVFWASRLFSCPSTTFQFFFDEFDDFQRLFRHFRFSLQILFTIFAPENTDPKQASQRNTVVIWMFSNKKKRKERNLLIATFSSHFVVIYSLLLLYAHENLLISSPTIQQYRSKNKQRKSQSLVLQNRKIFVA